MVINIDKKYKTNVSKYNYKNRAEYEKAYTEKERSMWFFALMMLKKDLDQVEYDSEKQEDVKWLNDNLEAVLLMPDVLPFTLDEWFKFMATQKD